MRSLQLLVGACQQCRGYVLLPLALFSPGVGPTLSFSLLVGATLLRLLGAGRFAHTPACSHAGWVTPRLCHRPVHEQGGRVCIGHHGLQRRQMAGTAFLGAGAIPSLFAQFVFTDECGFASSHFALSVPVLLSRRVGIRWMSQQACLL